MKNKKFSKQMVCILLYMIGNMDERIINGCSCDFCKNVKGKVSWKY